MSDDKKDMEKRLLALEKDRDTILGYACFSALLSQLLLLNMHDKKENIDHIMDALIAKLDFLKKSSAYDEAFMGPLSEGFREYVGAIIDMKDTSTGYQFGKNAVDEAYQRILRSLAKVQGKEPRPHSNFPF